MSRFSKYFLMKEEDISDYVREHGTLAGAFLIGVLENGLIMASVPYYTVNIFKGLILAIALALNSIRKK